MLRISVAYLCCFENALPSVLFVYGKKKSCVVLGYVVCSGVLCVGFLFCISCCHGIILPSI